MDNKAWMVWEDYYGEKVYHKNYKDALKDYEDTLKHLQQMNLPGEYEVYLFQTVVRATVEIYPDEKGN